LIGRSGRLIRRVVGGRGVVRCRHRVVWVVAVVVWWSCCRRLGLLRVRVRILSLHSVRQSGE
jgi:hypothetical protein